METIFSHRNSPYLKLLQCFGVSLFFHIALIALVGGTPRVRAHRPLVVDLLYLPPTATDTLTKLVTTADTTPDIAVNNPMPQVASSAKAQEMRPPVPPKPAVDLPVPFDSYLNVNEIDVQAEPANDVPLQYPAGAYLRHIAGVVRVHLLIDEHGRLDRVDIIEAKPAGIFEEAALEAVTKLHFYPATRYGKSVKSQKTIEVIFDPNPGLTPVETTRAKPGSSATEK